MIFPSTVAEEKVQRRHGGRCLPSPAVLLRRWEVGVEVEQSVLGVVHQLLVVLVLGQVQPVVVVVHLAVVQGRELVLVDVLCGDLLQHV